MLRQDLIKAAGEVLRLLANEKIVPTFAPSARAVEAVKILDVYSIILDGYRQLSPIAQKVFEQLELDYLLDSGWWAVILTKATDQDRERERQMFTAFRHMNFIKNYLPKLLRMFEREQDTPSGAERSFDESNKMTVIVIEKPTDLSTPQRIIEVMESVTQMYSGVARMTGHSENGLAVVACDSGSNKAFDFVGLGEVVRETKQLILEGWNQIYYRNERRQGELSKAAIETLTVIQKIGEMKRAGTMSPESAALAEREIVAGMVRFYGAGLIITEQEVSQLPSPLAVLRPSENLLLGAPTNAGTTDDDKEQISTKEPVKTRSTKKSKVNVPGGRQSKPAPRPNPGERIVRRFDDDATIPPDDDEQDS